MIPINAEREKFSLPRAMLKTVSNYLKITDSKHYLSYMSIFANYTYINAHISIIKHLEKFGWHVYNNVSMHLLKSDDIKKCFKDNKATNFVDLKKVYSKKLLPSSDNCILADLYSRKSLKMKENP